MQTQGPSEAEIREIRTISGRFRAFLRDSEWIPKRTWGVELGFNLCVAPTYTAVLYFRVRDLNYEYSEYRGILRSSED